VAVYRVGAFAPSDRCVAEHRDGFKFSFQWLRHRPRPV